MRHVNDLIDRDPTRPADYAGMPIAEAARLLGRGASEGPRRKRVRHNISVVKPVTTKSPRVRGATAVSATDVQHMSSIIAAAVGELNSELTVILSATVAAGGKLSRAHPAHALIRQVEAATRRTASQASKLLAFAKSRGAGARGKEGPKLEGGDGI